MAQDLDFPQTRTTCSLGTLGYRQGPWWRKPIISGLVDGRHKSLAKGREVYICCLVLEMQTQQQTWPELELLKEQSLNLVQMTNFERICDVPKVTLKISSKGGSRIKVSLFLGQNSPPISCLSRAGVLGKSACTIKEVTTSNGSKETVRNPWQKFHLQSKASEQGMVVRHPVCSHSFIYVFQWLPQAAGRIKETKPTAFSYQPDCSQGNRQK